MAKVKPFRAMMYAKETTGDYSELCCPPYDIISAEEQQRLYDECEHNAIYLELSPGEGGERYSNAAATLKKWLEDGIMTIEEKDSFYIYEEEFTVLGQCHSIRGLIARVQLEEFSKKIVLPHEETLSKAKTDRFNLMTATGCNFSQVYSMYIDDEHNITPKIDAMADRKPDIEFTYTDGVTHRLWIESDKAACADLSGAFDDKQLFIADGHHRYETALKYRDSLIEKNGNAGNADCVMMMLIDIDHPGLVVLPTHRILFGIDDFDAQKVIDSLSDKFEAYGICRSAIDDALSSAGEGSFIFYASGKAWMLRLRDRSYAGEAMPDRSDAYRSLDVAILHQLILEPVFGIDKENMASGRNLRYTRDADEAIKSVDSGDADAAFIINPTRVRQIKDVAIAGEKMPQKSTYFYPKLLTGLVFNNFNY